MILLCMVLLCTRPDDNGILVLKSENRFNAFAHNVH